MAQSRYNLHSHIRHTLTKFIYTDGHDRHRTIYHIEFSLPPIVGTVLYILYIGTLVIITAGCI